ncbi:hypothetical protein [Yersinia ruckeri]|uniref:hypothetical protein n=1 Tax=Yersinia ruckeri TaxID=29486 RepID=UPI002238D84E|nr:hypothetical protein [Yersinia ruckeri]MCW6567574.1 hypothetical protein [Yersinia ruckeri]
MLTIQKIKQEASNFREFLENCDKSKMNLVPDCFPVMICKLSSMLLSYHMLKLWPELELKGVMGTTGRNDEITHYWLEIGDIAIDITGDQYNVINANRLNKAIVRNRLFPSVHVTRQKDSYLYNLFKIRDKELLSHGFPTIADDFIEDMAFRRQR